MGILNKICARFGVIWFFSNFSECPNYGAIIPTLLEKGLIGITKTL